MHHTFGVKSERLLADRHMTRESAVEIFFECFEDTTADALAERLAHLDVLAGYAKGHGLFSSCFTIRRPRAMRRSLYDSPRNRTAACQCDGLPILRPTP